MTTVSTAPPSVSPPPLSRPASLARAGWTVVEHLTRMAAAGESCFEIRLIVIRLKPDSTYVRGRHAVDTIHAEAVESH
jgi:hypothetical protein